jgi:c-di-GMP-binding flagellar brake protein YcgR
MSEVNPDSSQTAANAVFAERRTRVRYTATLEATCRRTGEADGQVWSGRVVNISTGGIGLLLRRQLAVETLLDVELQGNSGSALRILRVRVLHSTAFKDEGTPSWLLGCAFARDLAEAELWTLLCPDGSPD